MSKKKSKPSRATLRVCELNRLFFTRYRGDLLPDDDSGRQDAWIMISHLAMLSSPALRIKDWLRRCAPWTFNVLAIVSALHRCGLASARAIMALLDLRFGPMARRVRVDQQQITSWVRE